VVCGLSCIESPVLQRSPTAMATIFITSNLNQGGSMVGLRMSAQLLRARHGNANRDKQLGATGSVI
jgi:hypothetical protein